MKPIRRIVLIAVALTLIAGWRTVPPKWTRDQLRVKKSFFMGPLNEGSIILFIHGTKSSCITRALCNLEYPFGINPVNLIRTRSVLCSIAYTLHSANPDKFPLDSFYFYSWQGQLTFPCRWKAAQKLYPILKKHKGSITLITHSHGANVALYLARCAQLDNNHDFMIEQLIMLAPPVQEATKQYTNSSVFRKIYNFYSTADCMQVADMQGTYPESRWEAPPGASIPFFSERTFPPAPHIWQARMLLDGQSPGHVHFLLNRFIKHLPKLITLAHQTGEYANTRNHCILNIPRGNKQPYPLLKTQLQRNYIPRSQSDRVKRLAPFKPD